MFRTLAIAIVAVVIAFGAWSAGKSACASVQKSTTIHRAQVDAA